MDSVTKSLIEYYQGQAYTERARGHDANAKFLRLTANVIRKLAQKADAYDRLNTCQSCGASLLPHDEPPHCDTCPEPEKWA